MLALYFIASPGLAHYTLALCSKHTFMMNLTIWGEAVSGLVLALCCVVFATRQMTSKAPRAQ